jgi:pimeloyl-ACP methyl ester carboxylesterase
MRCLVLAGCLIAAGCAAPYGVRRSSPEAVHRSLTANVLSTGELSNFSQITLRRQNLTVAFEEDPEGTLRVLHASLRTGALTNDDLFALAELSFQHAQRGGGKPHFLAAAVYAYAYVFPGDAQAAPSPFDPRSRVAMDLYNRALTEAFRSADDEHVGVAAGTHPLPFGQMSISFDERQLQWGNRTLASFTPAAELEVTGFQNRYRQPGIGAPLAAATQPTDSSEAPHSLVVGANVRVPVTLLLRVAEPRQQVLGEQLSGDLEIHAANDGPTTDIDGRPVPLEQEPTAALALALTQAQPWATEIARFLGQVLQTETEARLGAREPHRQGRIPVVLVHGTASNFSVWANMVNDLDTDPVIRRHFEFWLFGYDSGQPILYSAMQLRRALTAAERELQAQGADPCLERMVVIGHSQGGLLTKLTAVHSGDLFWRNVSDAPIEEAGLSENARALLEEVMFVEPLPFVSRVVFIATPQRGSYLAGPSIVRRLAERLITLPATLVKTSADLLRSSVTRRADLERLPTSIDNMSPGHPFIVTAAKIPVAPPVAAHSIIGVTGDGPLGSGGDGVVKYESAHIDGVESELIVPYPHSMQSKPEVVSEVQRILHRHLEADPCAAPGTSSADR